MKESIKRRSPLHNKWTGLWLISPWILGFCLWNVLPFGASIYISLTDWPIIGASKFVGFRNYIKLFTKDPKFYQALYITVRYAVLAIPMSLVTSLFVSILLVRKSNLTSFYRTVYYLPAVVSGVAISIVWKWILDANYGLINGFITSVFHVDGPNWLGDPQWVLPSYLIIAIWGAGSGILTYIVGLKEIPLSYYEAAKIDGASSFTQLRYITIPMITPVIFYNLIMGIIATFKRFSDAYIIGGAQNEGLFYMVYVYRRAFENKDMGYATALAWVLFLVILLLSLIVFKSSSLWVYYETNQKK